jgi:hypothetical protein
MAVEISHNYSTTAHTYLCFSEDGVSYKKLTPIRDYPDMGGSPTTVDISDLDSDKSKSLLGPEEFDTLPFTCNYDKTEYNKIYTMKKTGKIYYFALVYGEDGQDGADKWQGQISVYKQGGAFGDARTMIVTTSVVSDIESVESITVDLEEVTPASAY